MEATTAALGWMQGRYEQEVGRLEISEVISLVEQAKGGDRAAFRELMRAYSGLVYSLAFRMLGRRADAEDVFQETFLRVWSHLVSFRSGGNFTRWIQRIATNLCLDRLKARKRQSAYLESLRVEEVETSEGGERYAEGGEHSGLVNLLLAELQSTHRAAVVLFYLEDRSVEEVARTLKQKPGTIKVWLFRAREKMKAALEAKGYEF
ncbi:RNA polymerase sigma factor [Acidobacteria bacterium AH-259-D05]|nr:RNA polymerase sigma factor [Acidobacteria bacterium AH-259-D05]